MPTASPQASPGPPAFESSPPGQAGPQPSDFLLPVIDDETRPFWEGTLAGELLVQACATCGRLRFPPRPMCPSCHSNKRLWKAMSGRGSIWSFAVPHPPLLAAYESLAPYNVVVVSLAEDQAIRLVGNLVSGSPRQRATVDASRHGEAGTEAAGDRLAGSPGEILRRANPGPIEIGEAVSVVFTLVTAPDGTLTSLPSWIRAEGQAPATL